MRKSSCGCPYCRGAKVPETRIGWKGLKNNRNRGFGTHRKPTKRVRQG